jgi:hypothetical protein
MKQKDSKAKCHNRGGDGSSPDESGNIRGTGQESRAGTTPLTDALRGAVMLLPADFDKRAALTEELQKEHGVQG